MKEISIQEYHDMRNEAWDTAVKNNMAVDKDDFDESFYEYLLWEKGYRIVG